jgi:type IV pilus assembly protein PilQ
MVELADAGKGEQRVERYAIEPLPKDAVVDGNIANMDATVETIQRCKQRLGSSTKYVAMALPTAANAANPMSFQPGYSGGNTFRFALFNADATRIINLEIQASETDTTAKTISSPRVVAENNAPAKISSGTTYYMTIPASGNTQASSVTIDATLALTVTPQITPDGRVKMRLQVQDKSLAGPPTIAGADVNTREISTDATVDNGGTLVLGGVTKVDTGERIDKVPFLGDLPFLGVLFRTKSINSEDTELLVFITPRILDQKIAF